MRALVVGIAMLLALTQSASADEVARVRAHLRAAKARLATRDLAPLSPAQRERRARAIGDLDRYIERGVFPRRTQDAYEGLRPRFIDDRGVHCAVGQLIADSGEEDLSRAINAQYEYAYVKDMKSPALVAWADTHGFTVEELAIIQPAYAKPIENDCPFRDTDVFTFSDFVLVEKAKLVLECTGVEEPPAAVHLHVVAVDQSRIKVTTQDSSAFARCFAKRANVSLASYAAPKQRTADLVVDIPSPQQLFEREIRSAGGGYGVVRDCTRYPAPVVSSAVIDIESAKTDVSIRVTTTPAQPDVSKCVESALQPRLAKFHRHIKWHTELVITPRVSSSTVTPIVASRASELATSCHVAGTPSTIKVAVSAKIDDTQFTVGVPGTSSAFASCFADAMRRALRDAHTVNGYFRIDSDVNATHTFKLETPRDRDKRLANERAQRERTRRALDRAAHEGL